MTLRSFSLFLAVICSMIGASCQRAKNTGSPNALGYIFEPQPSAVLENLRIHPSSSPRLGMSTSGMVYFPVVYGKEASLGFFMSHNEGDTFMAQAPVSAPGMHVIAHGEASPALAIAPEQIYLVWQQEDSQGTQLLAARSLDWGHSFQKAVTIADQRRPSYSGFSSVAVAPNGDVYVVWLDGRDPQPSVPGCVSPTGTFSVYLARSTDHGASFGKGIRVALGSCPCCRPNVAFGPKGEIFVAWRKVFPGDVRDIVVATSHDEGASLSEPVRVSIDNWKIPGCPDSGPALGAVGSRLYVAWLSEGENEPGIRLSYSDDGAVSFTKPVIASGNVINPNHPALSVAEEGSVLMAFQGRDPKANAGWTPLAPWLVKVGASGSISSPKFQGTKDRCPIL